MKPKITFKVFSYLAVAFLANTACAETEAEPASEREVIEAYVEAYNLGDIDTIISLTDENLEWLSVEDGETTVLHDDKPHLMSLLSEYFASGGGTTSTLSDWGTTGAYTSVVETAHWTTDTGEPREQSAIAVYEIRDGLILRVWYYPAE